MIRLSQTHRTCLHRIPFDPPPLPPKVFASKRKPFNMAKQRVGGEPPPLEMGPVLGCSCITASPPPCTRTLVPHRGLIDPQHWTYLGPVIIPKALNPYPLLGWARLG